MYLERALGALTWIMGSAWSERRGIEVRKERAAT